MDEQQGFLQAIIAEPDEDVHRLVYADWLEEHDYRPWAELIRGQCSLARLLVEKTEPFSPIGSIELMSLVPELRGPLLQPFASLLPLLGEPEDLAEVVLSNAFAFHVHRGLIEALEIYGGQTAALFAQNAATITERIPLRHLRINQFSSREASRHYDGHAIEPLRVPMLRSLLEQPFITRLETLDLRNLHLRNQGARAILRHQKSLKLQALWFDGNDVAPEMAEELRRQFGPALVLRYLASDDDIPF